jgi:hypothetical protein
MLWLAVHGRLAEAARDAKRARQLAPTSAAAHTQARPGATGPSVRAGTVAAPPAAQNAASRALRYAGNVRTELAWDERILAMARPSVDPTLVAESLRLTPTERLARLQQMIAFVEHVRRDTAHAVPRPAARADQG